jgi:PadR family transcriptional regulator PadR
VLGLRRSAETALVLETFLASPRAWRYGYDLGRGTGLKSGTLYPILMRLADAGVLEASWQQAEPGRPPRHIYRLTADGVRTARAYLREYAAAGRAAPLREQLS